MELFRLPNGLTVVLDPAPTDHRTAVAIASRLGSRYESRSSHGYLHLLEHFLLKSTNQRYSSEGALNEQFDRLYATVNATTSPDLVLVWGSVLPRRLPQLLSILAECFLHPRITEGLLESEKGVVNAEYHEHASDAYLRAFTLFLKGCFFDSPLGRHSIGHGGHNGASAKELRNLWKRLTRPGNLVVTVAGAFDPEEVRARIARRFGRLRPGATPLPDPYRITQRRRTVTTELRPADTPVHLAFGFPVPGFSTPERLPLAVLANVLGGKDSARLPVQLREDGLVYQVKATSWHWFDVGYFLVQTACPRDNVVPVTKRILCELGHLKRGGLTRTEFDDAVRYLKDGAWENRLDPVHRAKLAAGQAVNFGTVVPAREYIRQLRALRRSTVIRCAKRTFTTRRLNAVLVGNPTRVQLTQWKSLLRI